MKSIVVDGNEAHDIRQHVTMQNFLKVHYGRGAIEVPCTAVH